MPENPTTVPAALPAGLVPDLDQAGAGGVLELAAQAHRELVALECRQLRLAAAWIDAHTPEDHPDAHLAGGPAPGTERAVRVGADGTPLIGEFAAAEYAAVHDAHPAWGATYLRKVANLRHRHPLLWERVLAGEVRAWKALQTAALVGRSGGPDDPGLSLEQARWVDARTAPWITTLPWTRYLELVEQMIVAADPAAAEQRRLLAGLRQGVWTTQSNEHGLKTLVAKAAAGDVVYLVAVVERLADILAEQDAARGAPAAATRDQYRAHGLTLLAHPARALHLLASAAPAKTPPAGPEPQPVDGQGVSGDSVADRDEAAERAALEELERAGHPSYLDLPDGLAEALAAADQTRMLPAATLYLHLSADDQIVAAEGLGAITLEQAAAWLRHRNVTVQPVLAPAHEPPTDGYPFPPRLREALHLLAPRDVFPWAVNTGRRKDIDHPVPYRPPSRGGPPGQTGLHNAAPMTRHHHRLKTHGRWKLRQLDTVTYLWTSPHGHSWLTGPTGTNPVPRQAAELLHHALDLMAWAPEDDVAA